MQPQRAPAHAIHKPERNRGSQRQVGEASGTDLDPTRHRQERGDAQPDQPRPTQEEEYSGQCSEG